MLRVLFLCIAIGRAFIGWIIHKIPMGWHGHGCSYLRSCSASSISHVAFFDPWNHVVLTLVTKVNSVSCFITRCLLSKSFVSCLTQASFASKLPSCFVDLSNKQWALKDVNSFGAACCARMQRAPRFRRYHEAHRHRYVRVILSRGGSIRDKPS